MHSKLQPRVGLVGRRSSQVLVPPFTSAVLFNLLLPFYIINLANLSSERLRFYLLLVLGWLILAPQ